MAKSTICLGCGTEHVVTADCEVCYERLRRCLDRFKHWPMETSITPAALVHVETAVRDYMETDAARKAPQQVRFELSNLASGIRSYLQHVVAGRDAFTLEPTDEELLS